MYPQLLRLLNLAYANPFCNHVTLKFGRKNPTLLRKVLRHDAAVSRYIYERQSTIALDSEPTHLVALGAFESQKVITIYGRFFGGSEPQLLGRKMRLGPAG